MAKYLLRLQNMLSLFEILLLIGKISKGKKPFLRGSLIRYISGMEGHRKFIFGEVALQICQIFLRENQIKKFPT